MKSWSQLRATDTLRGGHLHCTTCLYRNRM